MAKHPPSLADRARHAGVTVAEIARAERLRSAAERAAALKRLASGSSEAVTLKAEKVRDPVRIDETQHRWVVAAISGARVLEVADDLAALGFTPYCPLETRLTTQPKRGADGKWRRRILQKPLFGAYLFVGERGPRLFRSTHARIIDILGNTDGSSRAVSKEFIRALNDADLAGEWDHRTKGKRARFTAGQSVRVTAGPFADFRAVVARVQPHGAFAVELEVFGRQTSVVIKEDALEAA